MTGASPAPSLAPRSTTGTPGSRARGDSVAHSAHAPAAPRESGLLLFDGLCPLCSGAVRFVLAREREPRLRFAAMQSPAGERLMRERGFDPRDPRSLVLLEDGRAWTGSDAVLRLARHLRAPWRFAAVLRGVPRPLRDLVYDAVARHRTRWFGRHASCMLPGPEQRTRFLSEEP